MPRELIAVAPRQPVFREYDVAAPGPGEARVRSTMTTISHGTEMSLYRGTAPFATQAFERERRAFVPHDHGTIFPMQLGTEYVGEVIEIGEGVGEVAVGDLVYGRGGHKEIQQAQASELVLLPAGLAPEAAMFVHHGCVALNALHDAKMRLGDSVGVFGLGVIGLITLQMAGLSGGRRLFGADTFAKRRQLALDFGAEAVFDPTAEDAGLDMKTRTGAGVDVAFEVSGTYPGLQAAIRSVRMGGRIVAVGYYQGGGEALRLGEEFLHNRVDVVSTMYVWDCPHRDYPLWDKSRLQEAVFELLASGQLKTDALITHRIPWQQADDAYRLLDEHPDETVRVAITYD
jgi:2-desacetyl-2-hydroxyethyl bacteriochlorophyllide A dehydrogenase